jgi:hypothetical protein
VQTADGHVATDDRLPAPSSVTDDARWIVTEVNSRKLTLWALPEARRVSTFTLDVPVLDTALSPDGRFLVAGDQAGGVHMPASH